MLHRSIGRAAGGGVTRGTLTRFFGRLSRKESPPSR